MGIDSTPSNESGTEGKIIAISKHFTRRQDINAVLLGMLSLVIGGLVLRPMVAVAVSPSHIRGLILGFVLVGFGLYAMGLGIRRLLSTHGGDERIADADGLRFSSFYPEIGIISWVDVRGFAREPAPRKSLGTELLVVQLADSEKYVKRLGTPLGPNMYSPSGRIPLPFATIMTARFGDIGELEAALAEYWTLRRGALPSTKKPA